MLKELVEHLQNVAHGRENLVDGNSYVTRPMSLPPAEPMPKPLAVTTLNAVVGYLSANRDALNLEEIVVLVDSPTEVTVYGPLRGRHQQRACYVTAKAETPSVKLDTWIDREMAQIMLTSRFAPGHDLDAALRLISQVESGVTRSAGDDGVQQTVTVRRGAATKEREVVRRSYVLAPHRTFAEVSQPPSPFVLRIRGDEDEVSGGLFEADGGAWRLAARSLISDYLVEKLGDETLPVEVLL